MFEYFRHYRTKHCWWGKYYSDTIVITMKWGFLFLIDCDKRLILIRRLQFLIILLHNFIKNIQYSDSWDALKGLSNQAMGQTVNCILRVTCLSCFIWLITSIAMNWRVVCSSPVIMFPWLAEQALISRAALSLSLLVFRIGAFAQILSYSGMCWCDSSCDGAGTRDGWLACPFAIAKC